MADLLPQRLGQALLRELAGAVEADAERRDPSAHRGDRDDPAALRRAHVREHGPRHRDRADDVRLEEPPHLVVGDVFEAAAQADAAVVDEAEDRALRGDDRRDRLLDARRVGHVELHDLELDAARGGRVEDVLAVVEVAHGRVDAEAVPGEVQRGLEAEAGGAARDEDGVACAPGRPAAGASLTDGLAASSGSASDAMMFSATASGCSSGPK